MEFQVTSGSCFKNHSKCLKCEVMCGTTESWLVIMEALIMASKHASVNFLTSVVFLWSTVIQANPWRKYLFSNCKSSNLQSEALREASSEAPALTGHMRKTLVLVLKLWASWKDVIQVISWNMLIPLKCAKWEGGEIILKRIWRPSATFESNHFLLWSSCHDLMFLGWTSMSQLQNVT